MSTEATKSRVPFHKVSKVGLAIWRHGRMGIIRRESAANRLFDIEVLRPDGGFDTETGVPEFEIEYFRPGDVIVRMGTPEMISILDRADQFTEQT